MGAQHDGNSSAVVTVFGEMGGWQCYLEGWCLFPDAFMEFLTIKTFNLQISQKRFLLPRGLKYFELFMLNWLRLKMQLPGP